MNHSTVDHNWPLLVMLLVSVVGLCNGAPCDFDPRPASKWRACDCQPLAGDVNSVSCQGVAWLTIPPIAISATNDDPLYRITSLKIVEGGLVFLSQDSFKGQSIQLLDLSHNQIETINVNAFRGLESKLYQLSLNHNSLSSIPSKALTYMYQLQHLHLTHNRITDITDQAFDQVQLKNLNFLYLDQNMISRLTKGSLIRLPLQVLTMAGNRIDHVHRDALPSTLWYLNLKDNILNEIPYKAIEAMSTLSTLMLDGNNITTVGSDPKVTFVNPLTLTLSNNRISHLKSRAFGSFRKFKLLDLSHNQLKWIPDDFLETVGTMDVLDLSYNQLSTLPRKSLRSVAKSLRKLNLKDNSFHIVPSGVYSLRVLEELNINANKLVELDPKATDNFRQSLKQLHIGFNSLTEVPTAALQGMAKLETLDLSKNMIGSLHKLAFGGFKGASANLISLNLAGNRIDQISDPGAFLYLSSLAYLDLSHNRIRLLAPEAFGRLAGLETLMLHNNKLAEFPAEALRSLKRLRNLLLDNNEISALPKDSLTGLRQLTRLSITRNRLTSITDTAFEANDLQRLISVNLAKNRIGHVAPRAFQNLSQLEEINLQSNRLSSLNPYTFYNLSNLIRMNLTDNRISRTHRLSLVDLPRLAVLSLSANKLQRLEQHFLAGRNALEALELANNQFTSFNLDFFRGGQITLRYLDLSHNQLSLLDVSRARATLRKLRLRGNRLKDLSQTLLSNFAQLAELDLSDNGLIGIDTRAFMGCPLLTVLRLGDNLLETVKKGTFAHQETYARLDLSRNRLESIEADSFGIDNVQRLNLANNRLSSIPYAAISSVHNSLSHLDLTGNRIASLQPAYFSGMRNLSTLILRENRIATVEASAFKGLYSLRVLDLSHNPVVSWDPLAFSDIGHSIQTLNLADTGLFSLPRLDQRGIRTLNLSMNSIYELSPEELRPVKKVVSLDLSHNRLSTIRAELLSDLYELRHLNLSANQFTILVGRHMQLLHRIESLTINNLAQLEHLPREDSFGHLRNLRRLEIQNVPSLKPLNISRLLSVLPPLRVLKLEIKDAILDDQLGDVDCRHLRLLHITGRSITEIRPTFLLPIRGYNFRLSITDTRIRRVPSAVLASLARVNFLEVDLSRNLIDTIEPFPYTEMPLLNQQGTTLARLTLENNNLHCDCRLRWVPFWLSHLRSTLVANDYAAVLATWNQTLCASPSHLTRTPITQVRFYDEGGLGCGLLSSSATSFHSVKGGYPVPGVRKRRWRLGLLSLAVIYLSVLWFDLEEMLLPTVIGE